MCLELFNPINQKPMNVDPINSNPINQDPLLSQNPLINQDPINLLSNPVSQSIHKENPIGDILGIGVKEANAEKLNDAPLQRTVSSEILDQVKVQPAPMKFADMENYESIRSNIYKNRKLSEGQTSKEGYKNLYKDQYKEKPVNDPMAGLSEKERRKLKSRQQKDLQKAKRKGRKRVTGNTLIYEKAIRQSKDSFDQDKDKIEAQARQYASGDALSALFGGVQLNEKYKNKDDPPYDIKDLMKRMELTKSVLALYETETNADGTPFTLEKKAEHAALRLVSEKMQFALGCILESNGIKLYDTTKNDGNESFDINKKRLRAIAAFNKLGNDVQLVKAQQARLLLEKGPEYKLGDDYKAHESARESRYRNGIEAQKKAMQPEAAELLEKLPAEFADSQYAAAYAQRLHLANQKPLEYNQNKKVLDHLFSQFADNCRFLSEAKKNASDTSFLAHNAVKDKTLLKKIERSFTDDNEEYKLRRQNILCFKQEIDALLGVENVPIDYHMMVYKEYKVTTKELENYKAPNAELTEDLYQDYLIEKPIEGQESDHIGLHLKRCADRAHTFQEQCAGTHPKYDNKVRTDFMAHMCPLYDINENGQPLSKKDIANKEECLRIADDLWSKEHARILPRATAMMKKLISTKVDLNDLSVEKYPQNIDKIYAISMQSLTYQNLFAEYPWLKDELDPELFQLYTEVIDKLADFALAASYTASGYFGVGFNSGKKEVVKNIDDEMRVEDNKEKVAHYTDLITKNLPNIKAMIANCSPGLLLPEKPKEGMEAEFISDYNKYEDKRLDTLNNHLPDRKSLENIDTRLLCVMMPSVKFNASGEPRTPLDVQKKEEALQILDAYKNKDHDKMYQHLYDFSKDLLSIKISPEDVMPENFCKNIKTLKDFTCKTNALTDNIIKFNPWFLEELGKTNPDMAAQLKALSNIEMDFDNLYVSSMLTFGCSAQGRAIPPEEQEEGLGIVRQIYSAKYSESLENFKNYCSSKKNVVA